MLTCTSLITQSTQHYKGTHPTPALCPNLDYTKWTSQQLHANANATRYTLHATRYTLHATRYTPYTLVQKLTLLFLLMGPVSSSVLSPVCLPSSVTRAAIDLGCVLLLVIHEFLARQVHLQYILYSLVKLLKVILTISPCSHNFLNQ